MQWNNEKKTIEYLLENISKSNKKKPKSKLRQYNDNKKEQIICNDDFFFQNEITTKELLTNTRNINERYYLIQSFSRLKIGEINQEQSHLENYTPLYTSTTPQSYVLVTYSYSRKSYPTYKTFFSQWNEPKTFFHYFFSSYFYLVDSLILLNEKGIYPLRLNEETIFFNREKLPILSLPLTFQNKNNLLEMKKYLPIEVFSLFENKTEEEMRNLNNYQLSLLYLHLCTFTLPFGRETEQYAFEMRNGVKQLDKISNEWRFIEKVRECFQKVVFSDHDKRENLRETRGKIEHLFL